MKIFSEKSRKKLRNHPGLGSSSLLGPRRLGKTKSSFSSGSANGSLSESSESEEADKSPYCRSSIERGSMAISRAVCTIMAAASFLSLGELLLEPL
jgi:hypothetical protein